MGEVKKAKTAGTETEMQHGRWMKKMAERKRKQSESTVIPFDGEMFHWLQYFLQSFLIAQAVNQALQHPIKE